MSDEHLYIITYDIASERRWRSIFRILNGYGAWEQLSVFQCRITRAQAIELESAILEKMHATEDHVLIIDIGPAEGQRLRVKSLGKRKFEPIVRAPVII